MKNRLLVTLFLITSILSACKNEKPIAQSTQTVKTFKVICNKDKQIKKAFTGVVKEAREAKLAFQVPGALIKLNVIAGQYVKKGDLIAQLDDRNYKIQLQAAQAAFDNAKLQSERYTALYNKKSTSRSVYDQAQMSYKMAKAKKEAAENDLEDTRLYAPFSGYIQRKLVENFEKVGAGRPVVTLLDVTKLEMIVSLSETDYFNSNKFEDFSCKFNNIDKNFKLILIDIQRKPNRNNFYAMRLAINANKTRIVPGMAANITVIVRNNTTCKFSVPIESIYHENGKSYVWILDNNKTVHKKQIELSGLQSQGMVGVNKGLQKNDIVVAAGVHSIADGEKVKILKQPSATNVGGQL